MLSECIFGCICHPTITGWCRVTCCKWKNWTVHCGRSGLVTTVELLNEVFQYFIQLWSQQVEARKEREAREQSLYRYHTQTHGDGLNEDERDEKDIASRFPSFEHVS